MPTTEPAAWQDERTPFDEFADLYNLSRREREVLRLVLAKRTNAEMAAKLNLSESTIKFHMRNILQKTSCKNRVELQAKYASEARPGAYRREPDASRLGASM